jgi:hypothetical protein
MFCPFIPDDVSDNSSSNGVSTFNAGGLLAVKYGNICGMAMTEDNRITSGAQWRILPERAPAVFINQGGSISYTESMGIKSYAFTKTIYTNYNLSSEHQLIYQLWFRPSYTGTTGEDKVRVWKIHGAQANLPSERDQKFNEAVPQDISVLGTSGWRHVDVNGVVPSSEDLRYYIGNGNSRYIHIPFLGRGRYVIACGISSNGENNPISKSLFSKIHMTSFFHSASYNTDNAGSLNLLREWNPATTPTLKVFTDSGVAGQNKTYTTHTGASVDSWEYDTPVIRGVSSSAPMRNHADFLNYYMQWKNAYGGKSYGSDMEKTFYIRGYRSSGTLKGSISVVNSEPATTLTLGSDSAGYIRLSQKSVSGNNLHHYNSDSSKDPVINYSTSQYTYGSSNYGTNSLSLGNTPWNPIEMSTSSQRDIPNWCDPSEFYWFRGDNLDSTHNLLAGKSRDWYKVDNFYYPTTSGSDIVYYGDSNWTSGYTVTKGTSEYFWVTYARANDVVYDTTPVSSSTYSYGYSVPSGDRNQIVNINGYDTTNSQSITYKSFVNTYGWELVMKTRGNDNFNSNCSVYSNSNTYTENPTIDQLSSGGEVYNAFRFQRYIRAIRLQNITSGEFVDFELSSTVSGKSLYDIIVSEATADYGQGNLNITSNHEHDFFSTVQFDKWTNMYSCRRSSEYSTGFPGIEYFFMLGVNTSHDDDSSIMAFCDSTGVSNNWSDSWRGTGQIGTVWSLWNTDYVRNPLVHGSGGAGAKSLGDLSATYAIWIQSSDPDGFTGQHFNKPEYPLNSSEDIGKTVICNGNVSSIKMDEAYSNIEISSQEKDKRVYGVLSKIDSSGENIVVNSVGEGGILVCSVNGNIENGDYLVTSKIPGLAMKQDDDVLRSSTIAKATIDCDFTSYDTYNVDALGRILPSNRVLIHPDFKQNFTFLKRKGESLGISLVGKTHEELYEELKTWNRDTYSYEDRYLNMLSLEKYTEEELLQMCIEKNIPTVHQVGYPMSKDVLYTRLVEWKNPNYLEVSIPHQTNENMKDFSEYTEEELRNIAVSCALDPDELGLTAENLYNLLKDWNRDTYPYPDRTLSLNNKETYSLEELQAFAVTNDISYNYTDETAFTIKEMYDVLQLWSNPLYSPIHIPHATNNMRENSSDYTAEELRNMAEICKVDPDAKTVERLYEDITAWRNPDIVYPEEYYSVQLIACTYHCG